MTGRPNAPRPGQLWWSPFFETTMLLLPAAHDLIRAVTVDGRYEFVPVGPADLLSMGMTRVLALPAPRDLSHIKPMMRATYFEWLASALRAQVNDQPIPLLMSVRRADWSEETGQAMSNAMGEIVMEQWHTSPFGLEYVPAPQATDWECYEPFPHTPLLAPGSVARSWAVGIAQELRNNEHKGPERSWETDPPESLWNDAMYHAAKMIRAMREGRPVKVIEYAHDSAAMFLMTKDAYLRHRREQNTQGDRR